MKTWTKLAAIGLAAVLSIGVAEPASANPLSWGLDRLDQPTLPGNGSFQTSFSGLGVTAYVLDTGVNLSDPGFGGRASGDSDCNGHGTHVAGTIGSSEFGIAKLVKIVSIKVSNACTGTVTVANLVAGMEKVLAMHPVGTPGIVNISITVGKSATVDKAIDRLFAAGLTPLVAASNTNTDACKWSPSGTPNALTVASANMNDFRTNTSAFGNCVDMFAPGGLIISESLHEPNGHRVMSGTSMATPHVAGVAALYLQKNPTATSRTLVGALRNGALKDVVVNAQSPNGNFLVNTSFLEDAPVIPAAPVAPVVSTPSVSPAPSSSPSPSPSPTATTWPVVTPPPAPQASPAQFVPTQLPSRVNRLSAGPHPAGYRIQWDAVGNPAQAGPVTYKLEASMDNRNWNVVASGSSETFAVTAMFKFYRVSAVGALGTGPLGTTVMIGRR